jgi:hypothetical protein
MKTAIALILALVTTPAWAADFVFNVPVRLNNLDARVTSMVVLCSISSPSSSLGFRAERIAIPTSGDYNNTVRVEVSAREGMNPAEATRYRCDLITEGGVPLGGATGAGRVGGAPEYASRPGTGAVFGVEGPIQR